MALSKHDFYDIFDPTLDLLQEEHISCVAAGGICVLLQHLKYFSCCIMEIFTRPQIKGFAHATDPY